MPPPEKQALFDGQMDFTGGMDASRNPELIAQNQMALGVNVTVRGGYPATRPPFNKILLDFAGDDTAEAWWNSHLFQGAFYYNLNRFMPSAVASVGGHVFNLQPQGVGFEVTDITPFKKDGVTLDPNSSLLSKAYFCQAANYLLIQDGQSACYIFDGSVIRRANPAIPEVPTGTIMAYGLARVAVANGDEFLIGDINGGATSVIDFTETTYLNGGGSFKLPQNMGNVTAMIFIAQQDTQTGQGTLLVFGETGVISVNLLIPRAQWQASPIVNVTLTDIGTLSDRSVTTLNADVMFRSQDGIRSYRDARAQFGPYSVGSFGRVAMSYEIDQWLATDSLEWQAFTSAIVFDNRYLMTTLPAMRTYQVPVFQALAVMDYIAVTSLRSQQAPVFDGFWTGLDFYQLIKGAFFTGTRAFAFARNSDTGDLELWEIMPTSVQANDNNGLCPIQCAIETRSFAFGSLMSYKRMSYLRHWADQMQGRVDWVLRVKPDQYPGWFFWQAWTDKAPVVVCTNKDCEMPNYQPQYRAGRNSVLAPEGGFTDGEYLKTYRTGFSFQLRVEWTGVARLSKMFLSAMPQDIPKVDCLVPSLPDNPLTALLGCPDPSQNLSAIIRFLWDETGGDAIESGVSFVNLSNVYDNLPPGIWACYVESLGQPPYVGPSQRPFLRWPELSDFNPGVQPTAVDFGAITALFPNIRQVQLRLVSNWYSVLGTGNFQIQIRVYRGGVTRVTPLGNDYYNQGGVLIQDSLLNRNSTTFGDFCGPVDPQGVLVLDLYNGTIFLPGQTPDNPELVGGCQTVALGAPVYQSAAQTLNCPTGFTGGPFSAPAGLFTSSISQTDADNQATIYLNGLAAAGCVGTGTFKVTNDVFNGAFNTGLSIPVLTVSLDGGTPFVPTVGTVYSYGTSIDWEWNGVTPNAGLNFVDNPGDVAQYMQRQVNFLFTPPTGSTTVNYDFLQFMSGSPQAVVTPGDPAHSFMETLQNSVQRDPAFFPATPLKTGVSSGAFLPNPGATNTGSYTSGGNLNKYMIFQFVSYANNSDFGGIYQSPPGQLFTFTNHVKFSFSP